MEVGPTTGPTCQPPILYTPSSSSSYPFLSPARSGRQLLVAMGMLCSSATLPTAVAPYLTSGRRSGPGPPLPHLRHRARRPCLTSTTCPTPTSPHARWRPSARAAPLLHLRHLPHADLSTRSLDVRLRAPVPQM
jgi:hypothetical protein